MKKNKPLSSMTTPRFADIATFFRLPIEKNLAKLDYCICGIPWDGELFEVDALGLEVSRTLDL